MSNRRGSLLVELGAALTLVAIASLLLLQLLQAVARQKRAMQQHAVATQALANALEAQLARPFDEFKPQEQLTLPAEVKALLFDAQARLDVEEIAAEDAVPPAKQLVVFMTWTSSSGLAETSRLVAWRYETQEGSE